MSSRFRGAILWGATGGVLSCGVLLVGRYWWGAILWGATGGKKASGLDSV